MTSALSYSGINTKVRAMNAWLISKEDYTQIININTVSDFIAFLKKHPGYRELFQKYDERVVHRGEAEQAFINGLYLDYASIYRFANVEQRRDLKLIFFRYEINVLKACIRLIQSNSSAYDLSIFHPFFHKHSRINIDTLSASRSMEDYIQNLKGTEYFLLLSKISNKSGLTSFDYEMALDVYYFTKSWRLKDKILKSDSRKAFTLRIGTEIDLLNIIWIYRSKKTYDMGASDIFTYLIPVNYKLTKAQLAQLVNAVSLDEFMNLLKNTRYRKYEEYLRNGTIEAEYKRTIDHIYQFNITRYPASMAVVNYYLFQKDSEINHLTTALECIRYGLDSNKKQDYILQH